MSRVRNIADNTSVFVDGIDTSDIIENTNLYYTDVRARASISENSTQLTYNSSTGVLTYTQGDTDSVSEGSTNLYYTDARVDTRLSSGSVGNIVTTGYLRGPASFVIDPAAHGDDTGTVVIAGNLQVDGLTTTINSTTLTVDDLNIVLASGAADSAAANGAGITVDGAGASLTYVHSGTKFLFNKDLHITGGVNPTNNLELNTNYRVRWNDSNDYSIMSDSANYIRTYIGGAQILSAEASGINVTGTVTADGLSVNSTALVTGVLTTTAATVHTGGITMPDNAMAIFGDSSDLQIYHDGTQSFISEQGPSGLNILSSQVSLNNPANTENMLTAIEDGAVTLYHNGSAKLATTSTGIDVTGDIGVSGTVDGVDIAARDSVLTSTTTTANAALPKAGGTMTGDLLIQKAEPIINLRRSDNDLMPGLLWQGSAGAQAASIKMDGDSGTTNSLVMSTFNGSSVVERLRILTNAADGIQVTGNVGIGTSSPATKLQVNFGDSAGNLVNLVGDGATAGSAIATNWNTGGSYFDIRLGGTTSAYTKLRIDSSGNVGIGTSSPQRKLDVEGTGVLFANTGGTHEVLFGDAAYRYFSLFTPASPQYMSIRTASTDLLTVKADGNVGIGTTSPMGLLDLTVGQAKTVTSGVTFAQLGKTNEASNYASLQCQVSGAASAANRSWEFQTIEQGIANAGNIVFQKDGGNVGIGKVPTQKFEVEGGRSFFTDSNNFYSLGVKFKAGNYPMYIGATDSLLTPSLQFSAATGAPLMYLTYGGKLGIGTSSPAEKLHVVGNIIATGDVTAYYSDERLKDFSGTIPDSLDKVKQLNGYYFTENQTAKDLGYDNDKRQVGVSAQEVQAVLPEVVAAAPISDEYLTVKYEKIVPLLIEAIKELSAKVDAQQQEIDKLKGF